MQLLINGTILCAANTQPFALMYWPKFTDADMNYMAGYMIHRRSWLFFQRAHYRGLSLQHQALLPIDSADVFPLGPELPTDSNASTGPHLSALPVRPLDAAALTMLDFAEEVSH